MRCNTQHDIGTSGFTACTLQHTMELSCCADSYQMKKKVFACINVAVDTCYRLDSGVEDTRDAGQSVLTGKVVLLRTSCRHGYCLAPDLTSGIAICHCGIDEDKNDSRRKGGSLRLSCSGDWYRRCFRSYTAEQAEHVTDGIPNNCQIGMLWAFRWATQGFCVKTAASWRQKG